ncbi:MAG: hypothetical protein GTO63_16815, partial [Anaerolineae bacterium]|nr:hypothetical protein [Anaerolineae bacterium]NIN96460.1 hypothetical protein [Anaerolineae bacterium]
MGRVVQRAVSVAKPGEILGTWFYPGDELPDWADPLVTNETVFIPPGQAAKDPRDHEVESILNETSTATDYKRMNKTRLEELLRDRGLSPNGNKTELIKRLEEHDAATG